jgi:hypothetical protein
VFHPNSFNSFSFSPVSWKGLGFAPTGSQGDGGGSGKAHPVSPVDYTLHTLPTWPTVMDVARLAVGAGLIR